MGNWDGTERRKNNRIHSTFEPQTAFEGFVKANLENMKDRLNNLPCPETFRRLNKVENKISNIEGRATIFGIVSGFIAGFISKYLWGK